MEPKTDSKYYGSRKFIFSLLTSFMILGCGLLAGHYTSITANYPTIIGGLLGTLTIYCGGNLGDLHLNNKMALQTRDLGTNNNSGEEDDSDNKSTPSDTSEDDEDDSVAC